MSQAVDTTNKKMEQIVAHFRDELKNVRTGRANPGILDSVIVEAYGSQMRLKDLAGVSAPEPRQLLISPYDASTAGPIRTAILKANLNLQPYIDGNLVRINIPPMDEKLRQEMAKMCWKKAEDSKVSIRNARRDGNELTKKQKAAGEITEDMLKKAEKEIQQLTDKHCKAIDDLARQKETEVMTV